MATKQQLVQVQQIVQRQKIDFNKLAKTHKAVNFDRESSFALQILTNPKNDYLAGIAYKNPDSLKTAILNVAAIGLSLSPVHKLAYLVPRKYEICLDISYRGLIQLAIDVGSIKWAQAFIVYKGDEFRLNGIKNEPTHIRDPFAEERTGENIKGVYICVLTHDGDYLTHTMTLKDVLKIRDRSESWTAYKKDGKNTPWLSDEEEMFKKTCAKQGSKWWPMTDTARKRFEEAIDITNNLDPVDVSASPSSEQDSETRSQDISHLQEGLVILGKTEEQYLKMLSSVCRRDIKTLSDLVDAELDQATIGMNQWLEAHYKKIDAAQIEPKKETGQTQKDKMDELDSKLGLKNENTKANK